MVNPMHKSFGELNAQYPQLADLDSSDFDAVIHAYDQVLDDLNRQLNNVENLESN